MGKNRHRSRPWRKNDPLSRNERLTEPGFVAVYDFAPCPNCFDNAWSPPKQTKYRKRKGCETCGPNAPYVYIYRNGKKEIRVPPRGMVYAPHRDPYKTVKARLEDNDPLGAD